MSGLSWLVAGDVIVCAFSGRGAEAEYDNVEPLYFSMSWRLPIQRRSRPNQGRQGRLDCARHCNADTIAHYKSIRRHQFEPIRLPDGKFGVHKPRFMETDTLEFMRLVYSNNIEFHQDFMCLTLGLRAPGLVLAPADANEMVRAYDKYGKYVRWGWRFATPPVTPEASSKVS